MVAMRIAVFGDIHGHWLEFRREVERIHALAPLDFALQVGDAISARDEGDMAYVPVPERYRRLGTFPLVQDPWPVPTWFIGGNHEAWNILGQRLEGGEMVPNLGYLGRAGTRTLNGLRIAFLSGVYSPRAYDRPSPRWPFPPSQAKDASYYRRADVECLSRVPRPDLLLLHEWPTQMEAARASNWPKHWSDGVGIPVLGGLVDALRPPIIVVGHMHHPARARVGSSTIIALDDFANRPQSSVLILEGEPGNLELADAPGTGA